MRRLFMTAVCIMLAGVAPALASDAGPSAPYYVMSPRGFGPLQRGTIETLTIKIGTTRPSLTRAEVRLTGDSADPFVASVEFDTNMVLSFDIRRLQRSTVASLEVVFMHPNGTVITTATRDLQFVWGSVGVRLDSASSMPFMIGTPAPIRLLFSRPTASAPVDSILIRIHAADTTQTALLFADTTYPAEFTTVLPTNGTVDLGAMISVETVYRDAVHSHARTYLPLPIEPVPIKFKSIYPTVDLLTNNYGTYRSPFAITVPSRIDTFTLYDLPARCQRVAFSAVYVDGTLHPMAEFSPQGSPYFAGQVSIPVTTSELDVHTTSIRADVYVKDIALPFSVEKNVTFDVRHPRIAIKHLNRTSGGLQLRQWNPNNDDVGTLSPDSSVAVTAHWPVTGVSSSMVYFLSSDGVPLSETAISSENDGASSTFTVTASNVPRGTVSIRLIPTTSHMPPGSMQWDTTFRILPPYPTFQFRHHAEFTSSGAGNVNDILTIKDLPTDVSSVRVRMKDHASSRTFLDTTLTSATIPYSGDVLFSGGAVLQVPSIVTSDTTSTIAFFLRTYEESPTTLLLWDHPSGPLAVYIAGDGTLRARLNGDSLLSSVHVRTGDWIHIAITLRDTGIAVYADASLQGVLKAQQWKRSLAASSMIHVGDASHPSDSLFALAGLKTFARPLGYADLQRIQPQDGNAANALRSYPLNDGQALSAGMIQVREERTGSTATITPAISEPSASFSFATLYLENIGQWRTTLGRLLLTSPGIDALVTITSSGVSTTDTIPQLIQLQAATLDPDSVVCAPTAIYNTQLFSSEGWGPFNALAPVGSVMTYRTGMSWADVARTKEIKENKSFAVAFYLFDNGQGMLEDSTLLWVTPAFVRSQVQTEEAVFLSPRPLYMDRISSTQSYVMIETTASINELSPSCFGMDARVTYAPPPPLLTSHSAVGQFRQSKIPDGDHAWNTFTAYTDDAVETGVSFMVAADSSNLLWTQEATRIAPGVWQAKIDMAQCEPPLARVMAVSYDGPAIKRVSAPTYCSIIANRPGWLAHPSNVRWKPTEIKDGRAISTATVCAGPLASMFVPSTIPLFGDDGLLTLPSLIHARLSWDPKTNALSLDTTESSIETMYATHEGIVSDINLGATIGNNALAVSMTTYDIVKTVLEKKWDNIGSVNFNMQSANSSWMRLDASENLDIRSQMSQTAELYWGVSEDVVAQIIEEVLEQAEAAGEGPGAFFVELTFGPIIEGAARLVIRHNAGSDSTGSWKPRGTFPVLMGKADGPSLVGAGLSLGAGFAVSVQFLKGAAAITAYLTEDGDFAMAQAYTCTPVSGSVYETTPKVSTLASLGASCQFLLQSSEVWGAIQQTLYGPRTFFKTNLMGDDLRDLYPTMGAKAAEAPQEIDSAGRTTYPLMSLATIAAPAPHTVRSATHTYTTWIDQDHLTGTGTLNVSARLHGHDTVQAIHRIVSNKNSMLRPHMTLMSDTTAVVVWKELARTRDDVTASTTMMSLYASSDVHWAILNTERGVVVATGDIQSSTYADTSLRSLMIEGFPSVVATSDTSFMVAMVASDTLGKEGAIIATPIHGNNGTYVNGPSAAVSRAEADALPPHLRLLPNGEVQCTWISALHGRSGAGVTVYQNGKWFTPLAIMVGGFSPTSIDVDDSGRAAVMVGVYEENGERHERAVVIRRTVSGLWDGEHAIVIRGFEHEGLMQHPKITVRGDSAFIMVRSTAHMQLRTGEAVFRYPTAVVDLRTGQCGTGRWYATDSLSIVHDFDVQWEPGGIHVIAQEHLPFAGLHTNGTLKRPVGNPQMNLGMHTLRIADVITGLGPDNITPDAQRSSALTCAPTPGVDIIRITAREPFTELTVLSLRGDRLGTIYAGDATYSATCDISRFASGTYVLTAAMTGRDPVVSLLRVAPR